MKCKVIINPSSGIKHFQRSALMAMHKLSSQGIISGAYLTYTNEKYDAYKKALEVKPGEYDFIMVVGGDGTANEVINGIIDGGSDTPICILPAGTMNDFATYMGLPRDTDSLCKMIKNFNVLPCDVGKVNDEYFLNVTAGGTLSEVAHRVSTESKTALGRLAYYLEGAKDISSLKLNAVPMTLEYNGIKVQENVFLFVVANSSYVGGFSNILPKAKINDGLLDVLIIKKPDIVDILPLMMQIRMNTHIQHPKVSYFQTQKISISCVDESIKFQYDYDGELGGVLPIKAEVIPKAIKLVVPENKLKNFQGTEA